MASLNRVTLIGNVGKDPVLRVTENGTKVCNFSLATNEKRHGESVTEWHNIVAFNELGDVCAKWLKKGSLVWIEGKIKSRSWEKDGQKHFGIEIMASNAQFLDRKESGAAASAQATPDTSISMDDIAF